MHNLPKLQRANAVKFALNAYEFSAHFLANLTALKLKLEAELFAYFLTKFGELNSLETRSRTFAITE